MRRYYKREGLDENGDPHYFRDDEIHEALDNLDDFFFPVEISLVAQDEYMNSVYGEGKWTLADCE